MGHRCSEYHFPPRFVKVVYPLSSAANGGIVVGYEAEARVINEASFQVQMSSERPYLLNTYGLARLSFALTRATTSCVLKGLLT